MTRERDSRIEASYDHYVEALLAGNKTECARIVSGLLDEGVPIRVIYLDLLQAAMYHVGWLWEHNEISVAKEHLATSVTEFLLPLFYPRVFAAPRRNRKVMIACVANEYHQLGARMVADIFELNGWDTFYLGTNTPVRGLISLLEEKQPQVLALSLALTANFPVLLSAIRAVRDAFPALPILVGGQAFRAGGADTIAKMPGVTYLDSIDSLEAFLNQVP